MSFLESICNPTLPFNNSNRVSQTARIGTMEIGDPMREEAKISAIRSSKGKEPTILSIVNREIDTIREKRDGKLQKDNKEEKPKSITGEGMSSEVYWALVAQDRKRLQRINELPQALDQITRATNQTALHVAAAYGHEDVVQEVLSLGSPSLLTAVDSRGYTALHVASMLGRSQIVNVLINHAKSISPASTSTASKSKELIKLLEMTTSERRMTALHLAALKGHLEVVKVFTCEHKDMLWADEPSPLNFAVRWNHWDIVYHILSFQEAKEQSLTNARPPSPLHKALYSELQDVALKLMDIVPAYVSCVDGSGYTPLHLASYLGMLKAVRKLLKLDSSIAYSKRTENGSFPIHMAARGGHIRVYKELMQYCPDLETARDKDGKTVLHLAIQSGRFNFVRYILDTTKGDELINARDNVGNTALHIAIIKDLIWHVFLLLDDERVDVHCRNAKGHFPKDIIRSKMEKEWGTPFSQKAAIYSAVMEAHGPDFNPDSLSTRISIHQRSIPGPEVESKWRSTANNLLVAATLIATISFASIFTLPGQYESSGSDQGLAHFRRKILLKFFILVDAFALFSSIVTAILVIVAAWTDTLGLVFVVPFALNMAALSFIAMSVAFMLALILMINSFSWEIILVCSIGFIIVMILLLIFLGVTSPAQSYWRIYVVLRKIFILPQRLIGSAISEISWKGKWRKWTIVRTFGNTIKAVFKAKWIKHHSQR